MSNNEWKPDFNASRKQRDGADDWPDFIDWSDIVKMSVILESLRHVEGRAGFFYLATFTVLESDSAKYPANSRFCKSYHYVPSPRFDAESEKNERSFREMANLAEAANGEERGTAAFDANSAIAKMLADSEASRINAVLRYEQQPYTSKSGREGVGCDYYPA